jgi:hypothetical protein
MGIKYYTEEYAGEKNGLACHTDSDHASDSDLISRNAFVISCKWNCRMIQGRESDNIV